jgi:hypothetical protein
MRALSVLVVAVAFSLSPVRAGDQTPARDLGPGPVAGTGTIAGIIVTGDPPQPVRRAVVSLTGATLPGGRAAITDETGRFAFGRLAAGQYSLYASKPAYLQALYGSSSIRVRPTPISLAEGGSKTDITLILVRGAVIAGTVTDERGQPLSDINVQLFTQRLVAGERRWTGVSSVALGLNRTDAAGSYRVYGLEAGEYVVAAAPWRVSGSNVRVITERDIAEATALLQRRPASSGVATAGTASSRRSPTIGFAPIYYPGTTDVASAALVKLAPGEERAGIDFAVRPVPTSEVDGLVMNPNGPLPGNVDVRLLNVGAAPAANRFDLLERYPLRPRPDGRFTFSGVAPGEYVITATTPPPGRGTPAGESLWATANVSVAGGDLSNILLTLQPGLTVTGRVAFDATTLQAPPLAGVRVSLAPVLSAGQVSVGQLSAQTDADGAFSLNGIMPGRYQIRAFPPPATKGWLLRSVVSRDRDVADLGVEIAAGSDLTGLVATFTDRIGAIAGVFQDASGRPAPEYTVVLFPTDRALWSAGFRRVLSARPASDGRFTLRNLLAGEYLLAAATEVEPGMTADPEFLEQLATAAIPVTLAEGEQRVQDIRIR